MNQHIKIDAKHHKIDDWDLSAVEHRLVEREGYSHEMVSEAIIEFRKYMKLRLDADTDRLPMPSEMVDEVWHQFILFTRDYDNFCRSVFGRFIHHQPALPYAKPSRASISHFYNLYRQTYGNPPDIWRTEEEAYVRSDCISE